MVVEVVYSAVRIFKLLNRIVTSVFDLIRNEHNYAQKIRFCMVRPLWRKLKICSHNAITIQIPTRASSTEYRDTTVNMGGIDTGIAPYNTVVFGINNFTSQQSPLSTVWLFI